MKDTLTTLTQTIGGKPVYRRDFQKRDGRDLLLYGYAPHDRPVTSEDDFDVAMGGELRWHPLRKEWNIYAAHRQNRTFKPSAADNPLAPTQAGGAPTEIPFDGFELAVFENKFTSLHAEAPQPSAPKDLKSARAQGRCEVVVYDPVAQGNLHSIGQAKRRLLLAAWIDRYAALYGAGHKFVLPFENRGDEAGVTLPHPHGQIYAFPFVPRVQADAATAFREGYDLSAAINSAAPTYEVARAGGVSAFCPPFARFPFEVWVAPITRRAGPWEMREDELDGFAHLLGDMTRRYDAYFQRPSATMLSLHAAPAGEDGTFHFTAQFYPLLRGPSRVKYLASVEQSTGAFTVDVMPEFASKALRAV